MKSLRYVAAAVLALLISSCGDSGRSGSPILFQWEDYVDPPFLAAYRQQYGETPRTAIFADEDEAFAKMRAGYRPDVMGPCYYEFPRWRDAGLLQPIDTSRLKNWNKIPASLRQLPGIAAGPGKVWFVPHYWGNTSVTYRTDLAPEYAGRESWNILFDPKYRGRVAVLEGVDDTVPLIARMIGVDAYTMSDADWRRVEAKLRQLVGQVRFVASDDTSLAQGLASGELVAAMSYRIVYRTLKAEGKPVAYMNPPGGPFTYVCGLVIARDTANYDKALALIDSSLSDQAADYTIRKIGDVPANSSGLAKEPASVFANLGLQRDVDRLLQQGIFQKPLPNKQKIVATWSDIRAGL
ncbi:MAG TPA: extracellular solute-binding protein [Micropepsaceae bacterium]|nr:extracellular solute-binding protein [Micropepsaceae bacterium]